MHCAKVSYGTSLCFHYLLHLKSSVDLSEAFMLTLQWFVKLLHISSLDFPYQNRPLLQYLVTYSTFHRVELGKRYDKMSECWHLFSTPANVIFMYLQMKSSCVSNNIYEHIFRTLHGPCGSCPGAAGQDLGHLSHPSPQPAAGREDGTAAAPAPWAWGQAQAMLGNAGEEPRSLQDSISGLEQGPIRLNENQNGCL